MDSRRKGLVGWSSSSSLSSEPVERMPRRKEAVQSNQGWPNQIKNLLLFSAIINGNKNRTSPKITLPSSSSTFLIFFFPSFLPCFPASLHTYNTIFNTATQHGFISTLLNTWLATYHHYDYPSYLFSPITR